MKVFIESFSLSGCVRRMTVMGSHGRRSGLCERCFISLWRSSGAHRKGSWKTELQTRMVNSCLLPCHLSVRLEAEGGCSRARLFWLALAPKALFRQKGFWAAFSLAFFLLTWLFLFCLFHTSVFLPFLSPVCFCVSVWHLIAATLLFGGLLEPPRVADLIAWIKNKKKITH